jgi:phosphoglycerol transferase MdoB-like AlkP superfamily enzyme
VIILEESLGAEYVGCLGGLPLTPRLDRLSKEGLLFTNLYATGTRTVRGIEATVCGFLPTPGSSVVKLGLSQQRFFTLADLLQQRGYATEFIYGGDSQFDNMRSFFLGNGFQKVYDLKTFNNPVFEGTWGVSDEDLFNKANKVFKSHGDSPFFALLLSTSNHDPFEFPNKRIALYEKPKMTRHNAMKYADYALGQFFDMARKERYYEKTVFLVIADHSTRLRGQDLVPIHTFHIPGLIIGPNVKPERYTKVASQIDMAPTLLDLMGINARTPLIGRPLLSMPDDIAGRAVMQYGSTHAFMVDDKVIIQRPKMKPVQAIYKQGTLTSTTVDPDLVKDALAHALLPGYLYRKQLYCLQPEEKTKKLIPAIARHKLPSGKKNNS